MFTLTIMRFDNEMKYEKTLLHEVVEEDRLSILLINKSSLQNEESLNSLLEKISKMKTHDTISQTIKSDKKTEKFLISKY